MSQNRNSEVEIDDYDEYDDSDDDFEFIISPTGSLKSITLPKHLMNNLPEEVLLILEMFGIDDLQSLTPRTLH